MYVLILGSSLSGGKFSSWVVIPAFAGPHGATAVVLDVGFILLAGSHLCEAKCARNQGKVSPRNRDRSPPSKLIVNLKIPPVSHLPPSTASLYRRAARAGFHTSGGMIR